MNAQAQVIEAIKEHQGISAGALSAKLGMKLSTLSYHVRQLSERRKLFFVWDQGKKRLFVRTAGDDS